MSHAQHVGRIAQLCNLVSKPELNGVYVAVDGYNSTSDRYAIRTLVVPNALTAANPVSIAVKLSSLKFQPLNTFASKYPQAPTQQGTFLINEYAHGTVLDFANTRYDKTIGGIPVSALIKEEFFLYFENSCRVVGAPVRGSAGPTTLFPDPVMITHEHLPDDSIAEFENIHFNDQTVMCAAGKNMTFRRCTFSERGVVLVMGAHVLFENCLFENNTDHGVSIEESSRATLLNCVFRNANVERANGIILKEGCRVTAIHCSFEGLANSVWAESLTDNVLLVNCTFQNGWGSDVNIMNGSKGYAKGCRWQSGAQQAVKVEGPKRSTFVLQDSAILDCQMGVYAGNGKIDVTVRNTEILRSTYHGVHLSLNILGKVELSGCRIADNLRRDLVNLCGPECQVVVEGVVQSSGNLRKRVEEVQPDLAELGAEDRAKNGPCTTPLKHKRLYKKAGTGVVMCANCEKWEPRDVKFNKCNQCKNVCYCSRECQKTHWKARHKVECGTIEYA